MNNKKNKHLTYEDRCFIGCGMCFKHISTKLGKDQTTISKEIKSHLIFSSQNSKKRTNGHLIHYPLLSKQHYVCNHCPKSSFNSA